MADGNGNLIPTKAKVASPAITGSSHAVPAAHDRKMASFGAGREITVDLVSLNSRKTTFKGGRYIVLEGRVHPDLSERKEITLWNEVADEFTAATSFIKPTGQAPLTVTFTGAFRKKDAYFPDRDARLENWVFNAKGFEVDWRSPAGRSQYPATLRLDVTKLEERTSRVTSLPIWLIAGTDGAKNSHRVTTLGDACKAAGDLAERIQKAGLDGTKLSFELKGYWRMVPNQNKTGFQKLFVAQSIENLPQLLQATDRAPVRAKAERAR